MPVLSLDTSIILRSTVLTFIISYIFPIYITIFNNNYRLLSKITDVDTSYSNNNIVIGLGYLPYSYNCIFYIQSYKYPLHFFLH
jgi:hypothetical protein